jgi:hypothetical protein
MLKEKTYPGPGARIVGGKVLTAQLTGKQHLEDRVRPGRGWFLRRLRRRLDHGRLKLRGRSGRLRWRRRTFFLDRFGFSGRRRLFLRLGNLANTGHGS